VDVASFVSELLAALAGSEDVQGVAYHAEGPTVRGRAYFGEEFFLAFYYNQVTGTQAFALVSGKQRIWGIDYDKNRGWHLHPLNQEESHIRVSSQSISSIIQQVGEVISNLGAT
jgi:hypothetical protein